jgi:hypothetical protein
VRYVQDLETGRWQPADQPFTPAPGEHVHQFDEGVAYRFELWPSATGWV